MKHEVKYEVKDNQLVEKSSGDKVINNQQEQLDASWERKTIYPEKTARDFVIELQRQVNKKTQDEETIEKEMAKRIQQIKEADKLRPKGVDHNFWSSFIKAYHAAEPLKTAQAQLKQLDTAKGNNALAKAELSKQLEEIKTAWPSLFEPEKEETEDAEPTTEE